MITISHDFQPEWVDLVRDLLFADCIVAGGAVVRHLLGLPSTSDVDLFVFGPPERARETCTRVLGTLVLQGWAVLQTPTSSTEKAYIHERHVFIKGERVVDVIWCERWRSAEDVLNGFDLTCCQVGAIATGASLPDLTLVATEAGALALMRREVEVTSNRWPTTPARADKYIALGFRLVGEVPEPAGEAA